MDRFSANPLEIQKALQLTLPYWKELSVRHEGLDEVAYDIARAPLLQLMNSGKVGTKEEFVYDIRSAIALRVNGLVTDEEIEAFEAVGGLMHLYQAMVVTARGLRERVHYYSPQQLVEQARLSTFNGALSLLAMDMRDPEPALNAALSQLKLDDPISKQLFQAALKQSQMVRETLVLH